MRITPLRGIYRFTHIPHMFCCRVSSQEKKMSARVATDHQQVTVNGSRAAQKGLEVGGRATSAAQHKRSPSSRVKLDVYHQETGRTVTEIVGRSGGEGWKVQPGLLARPCTWGNR